MEYTVPTTAEAPESNLPQIRLQPGEELNTGSGCALPTPCMIF